MFNYLLHCYARLTTKYQIYIHSESIQLLFWNIFVFFIIFINFVEIPIILLIVRESYSSIYKDRPFYIYYYSIVGIFLFDMLIVRTRVSYQELGRHLTDNKAIMKHYITHLFCYDILAIISLVLSSLSIEHIDFSKLLFFLKIFSLKEIDA